MYEPGTFVFIRVPDHGRHAQELHPFSISSTPVDRDLRLSIKMVVISPKASRRSFRVRRIDVYGPSAVLTPTASRNTGGLFSSVQASGIAPFLSMLAFEQTNRDFRRIWLYYGRV